MCAAYGIPKRKDDVTVIANCLLECDVRISISRQHDRTTSRMTILTDDDVCWSRCMCVRSLAEFITCHRVLRVIFRFDVSAASRMAYSKKITSCVVHDGVLRK